jgi:hypothetical protein
LACDFHITAHLGYDLLANRKAEAASQWVLSSVLFEVVIVLEEPADLLLGYPAAEVPDTYFKLYIARRF